MFHKRIVQMSLVVLLVGAVVACGGRAVPIYEPGNIEIATLSQDPLTLEDVRGVIVRAAVFRRWTVLREDPGLVVAQYAKSNLQVRINIAYTTDNYEITYADSQGLRYKDGNIHRNYNRWIKNLMQQITKESISLR